MNLSRKPGSTGKSSLVGQERRGIYAGVWRAMKHAAEQGCWLEVIALSESVIADRLEARIAHLAGQSEKSRKIRTASQSASQLLALASLSDADRQLLGAVRSWSKLRNSAVHELAKVVEGTSITWNERVATTKAAGEQGISIARAISNWNRKAHRTIS